MTGKASSKKSKNKRTGFAAAPVVDYSRPFELKEYSFIVNDFRQKKYNISDYPGQAIIVAASLFYLAQYTRCVDLLSRLSNIVGFDSGTAALYGAALRKSGDLEGSRKYFESCLGERRDNIGFMNNYALTLIELGKYDEAQSILKGIVQNNPNYEDANKNLVYLDMHKSRLLDSYDEGSSKQVGDSLQLNEELDRGQNGVHSDDSSFDISGLFKEAFTTSEVEYTLSRNGIKAELRSAATLIAQLPRSHPESEDILDMAETLIGMDNEKVNSLLKVYSSKHKLNSRFFLLLAKYYLCGEDFVQAERFYMLAYIMGDRSEELLVNLASCSAMFKMRDLYKYWLSIAVSMYPESDDIDKIQRNLFEKDANNFFMPVVGGSHYQDEKPKRSG